MLPDSSFRVKTGDLLAGMRPVLFLYAGGNDLFFPRGFVAGLAGAGRGDGVEVAAKVVGS